jgi:anti-sigma factor RsiW
MKEREQLPEREREDLVAYLDGELPAEGARSVEASMSRDSRTRGELETLRRTWEMLDHLPQPKPSATFTSQTLERVSALRPATTAKRTRRWQPWILAASWAAGAVLAGLLGYAGITAILPKSEPVTVPQATLPAEQEPIMLRDLRIIENKSSYEKVGDINFLCALDDPELFGDER